MEEWQEFTLAILGILGVLGLIAGAIYAGVYHKEMKYENFQTTIDSLSDEQKCLHICGFQWPSATYLDNYKFCVEKCDRISEREIGLQ